jgi:UrcA family protein
MRSKYASAAVCLAAGLSATAAAAQEHETVVTGEARPTALVRYGDLDLGREAGVAALHARIYRAATGLCMDSGSQVMGWRLAGTTCRSSAIAGARDQVEAAIAGYGNPARLAAAAMVIRLAR